jgi:VanZ family protein
MVTETKAGITLGAGGTACERLHAAWVLAYLGFIVYGSLLPFEFRPTALSVAWERFQQTPMLALGIQSRADWIANGILYIPAGFLIAERYLGRLRGFALTAALAIGAILIVTLAFGVEFAQIFFPPRTVSQNDILAETIGALIGIVAALRYSVAIRRIVAYRPKDSGESTSLLLMAYMSAYIAYCLFPYDFLLSADEIANKVSSNSWGIFLADYSNGGILRVVAGLGFETIATLPFGVFLARQSASVTAARAVALGFIGAMLGGAIEIAQFFIYSGISQGASVFTRAIGVAVGAACLPYLRSDTLYRAIRMLRDNATAIALAYACLLIGTFALMNRPWGGINEALLALDKLRFLPFYYHYYTSEAIALRSLITVASMFIPFGILAWAAQSGIRRWLLIGGMTSFVVESTRLFSQETHADPTNVIIAIATIAAVPHIARRLLSADQPVRTSTITHPVSVRPLISLTVIALATTSWLVGFPIYAVQLGLFYLICAVVVWRKPVVAAFLIPAALPALDLAPWSGRFFLDEFDFLLATVLAVAYARTAPTRNLPGRAMAMATGLLFLSFIASTTLALLPWSAPDPTSFTTYLSPYNSLRIAKGFFMALLFVGLMRRLASSDTQATQSFTYGMVFGLAATVVVIVREKALFGGLLNFDTDYRAVGPFSAINTGGAYVECFIAVAVPFLIHALVKTKSWMLRLGYFAILLGSTYAVMATVSRNGYLAFAIACLLALLATLRERAGKLKHLAQIVILSAGALAVAVPLFQGKFVQQRFVSVQNDLQVRVTHWRDGLAMRDQDLLTELFGMGIGTYPSTHYWKSRENHHASAHGIGNDSGNSFLRIAPGNTLYVEQVVPLEPHHRYHLSLETRSQTPDTKIGIALCEKWLLASKRCALWQHSPKTTQAGQWQAFETWIDSKEVGSGTWPAQRAVKLSLYSTSPATIDIDNVRLLTPAGDNLVENGDFSKGIDHWFFATDEHLAWHIKGLPAAILFDQGWFGLLAFAMVLIASGITTAKAAWQGDTMSATFLAASTAFLVVGIFDTLIDTPRFLFLFIALQLIPVVLQPIGASRMHGKESTHNIIQY